MFPNSLLAGILNNIHPHERTSNDTHFYGIAIILQIYIANINTIKIDFEITATISVAIMIATGGTVVGMISLTGTDHHS